MATKRPASATGAPVGVIYSFEDSVAILPIAVGFKPSRGSLFPLLEAFTEYHPPNASILTQCLKPYNSKIYSELDSAMKFCNIDMRQAASTKSTVATEVSVNAYSEVFKKIQEIEDAISKSITDFSIAAVGGSNDTCYIVKNAQFHREDVFNYFSGTLSGDSTEMRKSLMSNFSRTGKVMEAIFPEGSWKVSDWDGIDQFNSFWDKVIVNSTPENKTKFTSTLYSQEEKRVQSILHIMQLNKEFYNTVYAKTNSPAFMTDCEKLIKINTDAKSNDKTNERNKNMNIVLWNMLIERFEMLNSFVNTYFGLVCNTKQSHIPVVRQFMYYAIYSCFSPIFNIYSTVVVGDDGRALTNKENDMNRCKEFISSLTKNFAAAYVSFFKTKLPSKITNLSKEERIANKNLILNSIALKDWDGTLLEQKPDSANFLHVIISTAFKESFLSCEHVKIPNSFVKDGRNFKVLNVYRSKDPVVIDVVSAMRSTLGVGTDATTFAKTVAYYQIFHNAAAYGYFHFKDFQLDSMFKYFSLTYHPLALDFANSGSKYKATDKTEAYKADSKKAMRVVYPANGWDSYSKTATGRKSSGKFPNLAAVAAALTPIFLSLAPKPNFKPETLTVTPPRPQSAPAARAATKQTPKKNASTTPKAKQPNFKKTPKKAAPRKKQPKKK